MPLLETKGAASAQGFGLISGAAAFNYIEDVFSTWLYDGNSSGSSTQTITNGIDLSGKGGLVFAKGRSSTNSYPYWIDSARGVGFELASNFTAGQTNQALMSSFNSNGFTLGTNNGATNLNRSGETYVSWTFRKQPKFFDVVTYTGNGSNRTIAHSLGSVPGCIIVKRTDTTADWQVYHRSNANTEYVVLNTTAAKATGTTRWNSTTPTSTEFSLGTDTTVNASGGTYVAYLFAHDAGGFGNSGTDNVISCGSFYTDGSPTTVNLGYEPQWLLWKRVASGGGTGAWAITDNMRGWNAAPAGGTSNTLYANNSFSESSSTAAPYMNLTSTGFYVDQQGLGTYIYIAIRRGPMRTPTTGTSVFSPNTFTTNDVKQTTGFPVDALIGGATNGGANTLNAVTRLQGLNTTITSGSPWPRLITSSTSDEPGISGTNIYYGYDNTGYLSGGLTGSTANVAYSFGRAPGFCDVVCYTGTGSATTFNHNLKVVP